MVCPMIRECQVRKSGIETKNINLISKFNKIIPGFFFH